MTDREWQIEWTHVRIGYYWKITGERGLRSRKHSFTKRGMIRRAKRVVKKKTKQPRYGFTRFIGPTEPPRPPRTAYPPPERY